MTSGRTAKI